MVYPKGTKFQAWCLYTEIQKGVPRPVIKRGYLLPNGQRKTERYPVRKYAAFRNDPAELQLFVIRLNAQFEAEKRARASVEIKHAFITRALRDEYERERRLNVPSQGRVTTEITHLEDHFLNFFIGRLNLPDPADWHRRHKIDWAEYLLSKEVPKAASTKRDIIQAANRFMTWLHGKRPLEVPDLVFEPLSTAKFKHIEAQREVDKSVKKRKLVKDDDWGKIVGAITESPIRPMILFGYFYGLRRSESLGVQPGDIRKGHLALERTLERAGCLRPLKGRHSRKVPHWFATNAQTYLWAEEVQRALVHPDTLTDRWVALMKKLNLTYDFHDLRHTFITKAVRAYPAVDVMHAAGHKNIATTMRYLHDDRVLDDEPFRPAS